jgi:hypothetical protein
MQQFEFEGFGVLRGMRKALIMLALSVMKLEICNQKQIKI